jgi:hypothetical protein
VVSDLVGTHDRTFFSSLLRVWERGVVFDKRRSLLLVTPPDPAPVPQRKQLLCDNDQSGNAVSSSYGTHIHTLCGQNTEFCYVTCKHEQLMFVFGRTNQLQLIHNIILLSFQTSFGQGGALVKANRTGRQLLMAPRRETERQRLACSHMQLSLSDPFAYVNGNSRNQIDDME